MLSLRAFAGLFIVLTAVFPLLAAPEEPPDQDPIQVGYVIITPVTEAGEAGVPVDGPTGLVAFETFGQKQGNSISPVGVLPSNMATSAMLFVNTSGRLSRNVGVAIANPVGGEQATEITLTLKGEDGLQVGQTSLTLEPGMQTAAFVSQMFESQREVPKDFMGSLIITSSNNPVAMMGLRFRGQNFSTIPLTVLAGAGAVPVNGSIGGTGAIVLAQFAAGGGWESEIVLANSGETELVARVDLYKPDGTPLLVNLNGQLSSSFVDITIPPGGVYVLARRDHKGDSEF